MAQIEPRILGQAAAFGAGWHRSRPRAACHRVLRYEIPPHLRHGSSALSIFSHGAPASSVACMEKCQHLLRSVFSKTQHSLRKPKELHPQRTAEATVAQHT